MSDRVHRITSLGVDAPQETASEGSATADTGRAHAMERGIDRVLAIQRPLVLAHLRGIRRGAPDATPDELVRILERRYLAAITTGGAAVGATAVIPGITTGVTLALSGVETAGFLEATALFAQSVAEVHGIPVENPERARALVMTLMLGNEGSDLVRQFAAQASGAGVARSAYWGELVTNSIPKAVMGTVVDRLRSVFLKQFAVRGGAGWLGKALPFGVGAAVGGIGNHVLGRRVVAQARLAFGRAPLHVPAELEPRGGRDEAPRATLAGRLAGRMLAPLGAARRLARRNGDASQAETPAVTEGGADDARHPPGDPADGRADAPTPPYGAA